MPSGKSGDKQLLSMSDPQDKDLSAIGDTFKGSIAHMKVHTRTWGARASNGYLKG